MKNDLNDDSEKADQQTEKPGTALSPAQRQEAAELRALGYNHAQARYQVLTTGQRRELDRQIRAAELVRHKRNPFREMLKHARNSAASARRRGAKQGLMNSLSPRIRSLGQNTARCFHGSNCTTRAAFRHDPAAASLDRIDGNKGYVPGNVNVVSLRANLLRKDMTNRELRALADFHLFPADPDEEK